MVLRQGDKEPEAVELPLRGGRGVVRTKAFRIGVGQGHVRGGKGNIVPYAAVCVFDLTGVPFPDIRRRIERTEHRFANRRKRGSILRAESRPVFRGKPGTKLRLYQGFLLPVHTVQPENNGKGGKKEEGQGNAEILCEVPAQRGEQYDQNEREGEPTGEPCVFLQLCGKFCLRTEILLRVFLRHQKFVAQSSLQSTAGSYRGAL